MSNVLLNYNKQQQQQQQQQQPVSTTKPQTTVLHVSVTGQLRKCATIDLALVEVVRQLDMVKHSWAYKAEWQFIYFPLDFETLVLRAKQTAPWFSQEDQEDQEDVS